MSDTTDRGPDAVMDQLAWKLEGQPDAIKALFGAALGAGIAVVTRGLPKWPKLLIKGESVTREQADDIIFRTDTSWGYISTNDDNWKRLVEQIMFGMTEPEWVHWSSATDKQKAAHNEQRDKLYAAKQAFRERNNIIETQYVYNTWIASCFIHGPTGWCHPDGTIYFPYNVGKWPDGSDILLDLVTIAYNFPFLKMTAVAFDSESCEDDAKPVMGFAIADGLVTVFDPQDPEQLAKYPGCTEDTYNSDDAIQSAVNRLMGGRSFERGISEETLRRWAERDRLAQLIGDAPAIVPKEG